MATAAEKYKALEAKQAELDTFVKSRQTPAGLDFKGEDDIVEFNKRNEELKSLFDDYDRHQKAEDAVKGMDAYRPTNTLNLSVPYRTGEGAGENERTQTRAIKSVGQQFVESAEFKAARNGEILAGQKWQVELNGNLSQAIEAAQNSAIKATVTTSIGVVPYPAQSPNVIGYPQRTPTVRDLLQVTELEGTPLSIWVEETALTQAADTVAEGATKPQSDFTTTRRTGNAEVIAHRFKVSNQALEDIPGIRDRLDFNGTLGLQLAEEEQILNGSGTTPDLQGFLTKTGVQTQALGSYDPFTAFMRARTKVQVVGRARVTFGIANPYDWEKIVLQKDTTGRFIYGNPFEQTGAPRLWGIPFVTTDAITEGTSLVGDRMYSRFRPYGGIRVIVGYSGDDIDRNLQTIVMEERALLEIYRATAYCTVTGLNALTY